MTKQDPSILKATIFEIIENQMRDGSPPPETKMTYDRLIALDNSHEETMKMIGCVLTSELFDMLKKQQLYDETRYLAGLRALPKLPWE